MDRTNASATSKVGPTRALLRFERLPALYIHPDRLAQCLPQELRLKQRDRLLNTKRLGPRLSGLLMRRFELRPCSLHDFESSEGQFAQIEGEELALAIRRIGAIWHARSVAAIILARSLKDLVSRLGKETYREALRQADLAGADLDQGIAEGTPAIDRLSRNIDRDGQRCIRAWCEHQPISLAQRLILKLDPAADVEDDMQDRFRNRGVIVTDRVMMTMAGGHG